MVLPPTKIICASLVAALLIACANSLMKSTGPESIIFVDEYFNLSHDPGNSDTIVMAGTNQPCHTGANADIVTFANSR